MNTTKASPQGTNRKTAALVGVLFILGTVIYCAFSFAVYYVEEQNVGLGPRGERAGRSGALGVADHVEVFFHREDLAKALA